MAGIREKWEMRNSWLGLHTHMGGIGLDDGCLYGGKGAGMQ